MGRIQYIDSLMLLSYNNYCYDANNNNYTKLADSFAG